MSLQTTSRPSEQTRDFLYRSASHFYQNDQKVGYLFFSVSMPDPTRPQDKIYKILEKILHSQEGCGDKFFWGIDGKNCSHVDKSKSIVFYLESEEQVHKEMEEVRNELHLYKADIAHTLQLIQKTQEGITQFMMVARIVNVIRGGAALFGASQPPLQNYVPGHVVVGGGHAFSPVPAIRMPDGSVCFENNQKELVPIKNDVLFNQIGMIKEFLRFSPNLKPETKKIIQKCVMEYRTPAEMNDEERDRLSELDKEKWEGLLEGFGHSALGGALFFGGQPGLGAIEFYNGGKAFEKSWDAFQEQQRIFENSERTHK